MEADSGSEDRIRRISEQVDSVREGMKVYDDTMVRQMIECVRIHKDGKTEIIFGGGIVIDEYVSPILRQEKYKPRRKPS